MSHPVYLIQCHLLTRTVSDLREIGRFDDFFCIVLALFVHLDQFNICYRASSSCWRNMHKGFSTSYLQNSSI